MVQSKASGIDIKDEPLDNATVRHVLRETAGDVPPAGAKIFERIERSIEQTQSPASGLSSSTAPARAILDRLRDFFGSPQLAWGVVGIQAIALCFFIIHVPVQKSYQTLSVDQAGHYDETAPIFYVIFREDAQVGEVKLFLEKNSGMIVNGPGRQGIYTIRFTRNPLLTAKEQAAILSSSPLVIFADQVY